MIAVHDITGLVLAGGRGSRMGGVDKGLQNHRGMPLALHALLRLQPQVGELMVNANRNLGAYEAFGAPVWPDPVADYPGPLAGLLAALERCETPWLVSVPCGTPDFPADLVERLATALDADGTEIAMAATREQGELRTQPVFCLLQASLLDAWVEACPHAVPPRCADPGFRREYVAQMAASLVEYPPTGKPATFGISAAMAKLGAGIPSS